MSKIVRDKIIELEKELKLDNFVYNNLNYWPFIRTNLWFLLSKEKIKKKNYTKIEINFFQKIFILCKEFFFFIFSILVLLIKKNCIISINYNPYLTNKNKKKIDINIDPYFYNYKDRYLKLLLDDSSKNDYFFKSIKLNFSFFEYLINKFSKIDEQSNKIINEILDSDFYKIIKKKKIPFSLENLKADLNLFMKYKVFFGLILFFLKPKLVVCSDISNPKIKALIYECHKKKIKSICIQHGQIPKYNLIYNDWNFNKINNIFPTYFGIWGKFNLKNFNKNKIRSKILIIGFKWLEEFKREINVDNKKKVLITLQYDGLTSFKKKFQPIITFINKRKEFDLEWQVRLHPREYFIKQSFLKHISLLNQNNLKIVPESENIVESIINSDLIISLSSSTLVIANYFNVPTIILDKNIQEVSEFYKKLNVPYQSKSKIFEMIKSINKNKKIKPINNSYIDKSIDLIKKINL